jgi:DNA-binding transcriptional regulator YbjK
MAKSKSKSGGSQRGAKKRAVILDAAVRVIARDGTRGATHRAVAAEAGVPLAATTYYFASRDDLIAEAFEHLARADIAALDKGVKEIPKRMSVEFTASLFASIVAEELRDDPDKVLAEHEMHLEAGRRPEMRETHRAWSDAAMRFFMAGVKAAGSKDPEADAALVLSVISGIQLGHLADPDPALERDLLGPLMRHLLHALIPDRG